MRASERKRVNKKKELLVGLFKITDKTMDKLSTTKYKKLANRRINEVETQKHVKVHR